MNSSHYEPDLNAELFVLAPRAEAAAGQGDAQSGL